MRATKVPLTIIILIIILNTADAISQNIQVDVISTRDIRIDFMPIDNISSTYSDTVSTYADFINHTYPVSDSGLTINKIDTVYYSGFGANVDALDQLLTL